MTGADKNRDLRVRTKEFGGLVVGLFVSLDKRREELRVLGKQILRSGTSVGANYREASRARSESEFIAKIELCAQEADETHHWLELLRDHCKLRSGLLNQTWNEADELIRIFVSMSKKTKAKKPR
jgi:four helix bundle protein